MAWSKLDGAAESENSSSDLQLEEQAYAEEGKAIRDYKPNIDYETKRADFNDESITQEKGKENSFAEYAKMEFFTKELLNKEQCTMGYKIRSSVYMLHENLR